MPYIRTAAPCQHCPIKCPAAIQRQAIPRGNDDKDPQRGQTYSLDSEQSEHMGTHESKKDIWIPSLSAHSRLICKMKIV